MPHRSRVPKPWRSVYLGGFTFLSEGLLPGMLAGALIGGIGGRLAMLLLRLLSDDSLHGMETDDGFTIGAFTGATLFLVVLTTLLGAVGGLVYLCVREWLPRRWRAVLFGLLGATVGGSLAIRPNGLDFTLLSPLPLAVGLFILLPAVYGALLSLVAERLIRSGILPESRWRWVSVLPLVALVLVGGPGVVMLLVICIVIAFNRSGGVTVFWLSKPVVWLGRGGFATAIAGGGVFLVRDVAAVL